MTNPDIQKLIKERPDSFDYYDNRERTPEQIKKSADYARELTERHAKFLAESQSKKDAADDTTIKIAQADKELIEKFGADAFDDFDCRPGNSYPEANSDAVTPDYIKKMLAGESNGADNDDAAGQK